MTETVLQYYAFISYSHKDEAFAAKLQKRLSFYKLPSVIRKENPRLPEYIRPVFRDKTNLTAGLLRENLHGELDESKFLIVICSPDSAQSNGEKHWVNDEVRHFIDIGRREYIIPIIVSGEPNADDPERECFCPALKKTDDGDEFLGIDARSVRRPSPLEYAKRRIGVPDENDTEERAFVHVVAKLLGLKFDNLWDWHKKEEKRTALKRFAIVASCVLLVLCGALVYWRAELRTTFRYYADYADKWGMPTGIHELTKAQTRPRYRHYRFEYRAGKLRRVVYGNSAGSPMEQNDTEYQDRPVIQELEYNGNDGKLAKISFEDRNGKTLVIREYRADLDYNRVDLKITGVLAATLSSSTTSMTESAFSVSGRTRSTIESFAYERDKNGFITKEMFERYPTEDVLASDADGVYGFSFERDKDGRVVAKWYLGPEEKRQAVRNGVAGRKYIYDGSGNLIRTEYVDTSGKPVFNEMFWMIDEEKYDKNGNSIEEDSLDEQGLFCLRNDGSAKRVRTYDASGNILDESYFGTDGNPVLIKDGYAKCLCVYDRRGYCTEYTCFGTDGKPVLNKMGFTKQTAVYDDRGNAIETSVYGLDGQLIFDKDGMARWTSKYDERGNCTEYAYYGTDGKPVLCKDGYAKQVCVYDKNGIVIETSVYGVDGKPILDKSGIARWTSKYERGNCTEYAYYGTDGKPVLSKDGYAKECCVYDDRGNVIETSVYDVDGKLILDKDGVARWTNKYERGNCTEYAYYGTDGKPVLSKDGFAKQTCVYDECGKCIETSVYGVDGKPILDKSGIARRTNKYERGNCTEYAYYGTNGKPVLSKDGYAKECCVYDERGNCIEYAYYGISGKPTVYCDGYSVKKDVYDGYARVVEESYYDVNGKPCRYQRSFHKAVAKYDERGNEVFSAAYDENGHLVLSVDGYAAWTQEYDERGNRITKSCLGIDGNFVLCKDGYAIQTYKYNERGSCIETRNYDVEKKLVLDNNGIARWTQKYDERGNCIEYAYFGIDGKPVLSRNGYAKEVDSYDELGNCIKIDYYDTANAKIEEIPLAVIAEIVKSSPAQDSGFAVGDIILKFGDWEYFKKTDFSDWNDLVNTMMELKDKNKEVIVYDKEKKTICRYDFKPGLAGIRLEDFNCHNAIVIANLEKMRTNYLKRGVYEF
jgi:YD repeat-containing protein